MLEGEVRTYYLEDGPLLNRVASEEHLLCSGRVEATWLGDNGDGRISPSGIYVVRLEAGTDRIQKRIVVLR